MFSGEASFTWEFFAILLWVRTAELRAHLVRKKHWLVWSTVNLAANQQFLHWSSEETQQKRASKPIKSSTHKRYTLKAYKENLAPATSGFPLQFPLNFWSFLKQNNFSHLCVTDSWCLKLTRSWNLTKALYCWHEHLLNPACGYILLPVKSCSAQGIPVSPELGINCSSVC